MSRIGKKLVALPSGVEVTLDDEQIIVKGPLGTICQKMNRLVKVICNDDGLRFEPADSSAKARKMWGTMRKLVANMVVGVTEGFEKKLILVGVGFRAQTQEKKLNLSLGFSHPIIHVVPDEVEVKAPIPTEISFRGKNKQVVGESAAKVRKYRRCEPYKGKGLHYTDEVLVRKEVKKK